LTQLERRYRAALSGAVVAKAYYLALSGERASTTAAIEQARRRWKTMESHRHRLAAQILQYDESGEPVMVDLFAEQPAEITAP
jgi:hypothetical protein